MVGSAYSDNDASSALDSGVGREPTCTMRRLVAHVAFCGAAEYKNKHFHVTAEIPRGSRTHRGVRLSLTTLVPPARGPFLHGPHVAAHFLSDCLCL
jgi:hypothetical protein